MLVSFLSRSFSLLSSILLLLFIWCDSLVVGASVLNSGDTSIIIVTTLTQDTMMVMNKKKVHHIARTMPSNRMKKTTHFFRFMPFIFNFDSNIFDSIRLLCFSFVLLLFSSFVLFCVLMHREQWYNILFDRMLNNDNNVNIHTVFGLILMTDWSVSESQWLDINTVRERKNPDYYYYEFSMWSHHVKRENETKRKKMA